MATKKITFDPESGVAYPCVLIMNVGADFSATFNVVDTTASSGYGLTISLGSTDTRSVKAGRYVYDILVGSGATVYRIVDGNIQVRGGVSSAP